MMMKTTHDEPQGRSPVIFVDGMPMRDKPQGRSPEIIKMNENIYLNGTNRADIRVNALFGRNGALQLRRLQGYTLKVR